MTREPRPVPVWDKRQMDLSNDMLQLDDAAHEIEERSLPVSDGEGPKKRRASNISPKSLSAAKRDAVWMAEIRDDRSHKALKDLFEVYGPRLKGWLMARGVGDGTAEDIVQDVMIKVWTRAHLFDPAKASFATWIYRTTRNRWIDHKRKHSRMDVREPEFMRMIADDEVPSAEYNFMLEQDSNMLYSHIEQLTPVQKSAIQMAFMEFKTHRAISEQTGIPIGTVKTRIRSAIKALKKNIGQTESNVYGN